MPNRSSLYLRQKIRVPNAIGNFLENSLIKEKLFNLPGLIFILGLAGMFGYLIAAKTFIGIGLFGLFIGFFVVVACLINSELALCINIFYCFFVYHFSRLFFNDEFPVGVICDLLIYINLLGLFLRKTNLKKNTQDFFKTSVAIGVLLLVFYLFIELFNPYGHSFEGWLQTFRRFFSSVILLFVSYNIFTNKEKVERFLKILFVACTLTALYGCFQQWHGLFDFERNWITSNPNRFGLYFIMGDFRKFSTMSDPTAFGVAMAGGAIFFTIIAWNKKKLLEKVIYFIGVILMLMAMGYSGTRTANVVAVAGLAMFIMLSLNKKATRIFAIFATLGFLFLLYGPYANPTIIRFRTSFMGSKDESFKVRDLNRARIQPYIHTHPIGGGIGTTGGAGLQFNRGHELAGFPPDSGYLRKALETGWIGLLLVCILYFVILKYTIRRYFKCGNEKLKVIYAAGISTLFSFYLAEFAQEAIGQITDIMIYYPLLGILLKMEHFPEYTQIDSITKKVSA